MSAQFYTRGSRMRMVGLRLGGLSLLLVALGLGQAVAGQTVTVPGVVNNSGLAGSHYVSDLTITNVASVPATVSVVYIPAGGVPTPVYTALIDAGFSRTWANVLGAVFGASQSFGMLRIGADVPVDVRAKTYNDASTPGTYGSSLPVVPDTQLFAGGATGESIWYATEPVADGRGYRSNVAIAFPLSGGGSATARVYDATGALVGHPYAVTTADPAFFQTDASGFGITSLPIGRVELEVTSGSALGYVVNNDNVTSDSTIFAFQPQPSAGVDVILNGVARSPGAAGTHWRTDGRLWNPAHAPANVAVWWFGAQTDNMGAPQRTLTLAPGQVEEIDDLLGSVFGAPDGSSGALRFQSASPVVVAGRTSNLDPTGMRAGTFGAQQSPVPLASFVEAGSVALMTAIEQDAAFRTNVGLLAGAAGASLGLSLLSPAGVTLASATDTLGPFGWTQPNIGALFPATLIPAGAQLRIDAITGSFSAYDSKIDNGSGDPVVTPASPLAAVCGSASPIAYDCNPATGCSQISVAGDPVDTTAPSGFYGNLDPCVRRDPNGEHLLYLTYSYPTVVSGTATPVIEIHLASSRDGGATWSFVSKLWPWVRQPDGNYSSHEVSSIAAQNVNGMTTWYGTSHYYEVLPGGSLYGPVFTPSSYYVLTSAKDPALLGSAPDDSIHLNGAGTTSAYSPASFPNLSTIAGDAACATWREPALLVQGDTLFFVAQCGLVGGAFSYYGVFAAKTVGPMSTWTWKFLGKLFHSSDAAQFLPGARSPLFTELDLSQKRDGQIVAIMSVMDQGTSGTPKYGSRTADVATLGDYDSSAPAAMVRDCAGALILSGSFTANDLNTPPNEGPGASTYEAADSALGVLIARRGMTPNVHGFTFRTGQFPK
jgi:hypothetical protein